MRAVSIKCGTPDARRYRRRAATDTGALLKLLSLDSCELSLVLTGDSAIQELNRTFRGKDRPTDVLSFPQFDNIAALQSSRRSESIPIPLGDVVISIDTATRQAEQLGVTPGSRMLTLLIHGLLHLLGYDHEKSRADARRMFALERELAAALASAPKRFRAPSQPNPASTAARG
jgi:probable rRNA maturation factor